MASSRRHQDGLLDDSQNNDQDEEIKLGFIDTIRYNWGQIRQQEPLKSKEESDHQLEIARDEICKEKEKTTRKFQEKYSYTNIKEHKNNMKKMLFYLIYIILFLAVVLMQLRKTTSFSHKSSEEILEQIEV
jgi:hypothetical protein